jgi:hypothetical protein
LGGGTPFIMIFAMQGIIYGPSKFIMVLLFWNLPIQYM